MQQNGTLDLLNLMKSSSTHCIYYSYKFLVFCSLVLLFFFSWKNVNGTPTLFSPSDKFSVVPGNLNPSAFCVLLAQYVSKVIAQHTETFAII